MKAEEFVSRLKDAATNYDTVYVMGCFGAPITEKTLPRYIDKYSYNRKNGRDQKLRELVGKGYFGFDCICLIKGILWGWTGDEKHEYGGAVYKSSGVDDITLERMLDICTHVSDDFSSLLPGEYLFTDGHCGIYIGNGLAVEATPAFAGGVQLTAVSNMGKLEGYPSRKWQKHGKLPYIEYPKEEEYIKIKKKDIIFLRDRLTDLLA